jgi:hypothetical protein
MIRDLACLAVLAAGLIAGPGAATAMTAPAAAGPIAAAAAASAMAASGSGTTGVSSDTNQGNGCPPGTVPNPAMGGCCVPGVAHCPLSG